MSERPYLVLPEEIRQRPTLPPMTRPDPERVAFSRKLGYKCAVVRGGSGLDTSLQATVRRMEAVAALFPRLQAEQLADGRAGGSADGQERIRPPTQNTTSSLAMTDVIVSVAPNPKKPGSSTRERYEHWRVGETLAQARARGLTMADLKWDIEHGFIVVRKG